MSDNESKIQDVFGIKAYGEAIKIVAQGAVDGAAAVLSRICNPVAEEIGFYLRDKVSERRPLSEWRMKNFVRHMEMTEKLLQTTPEYEKRKAPPRLVRLAIEQGSWVEADEVRDMWAGLLASSCTEDGKDESNLIFMNILSQMTTSEARMLSYGCEHAEKSFREPNWVDIGMGAYVTLEQLKEISGVNDIHRIDRESDHMRTLGLIGTGFFRVPIAVKPDPLAADLRPTDLGLQMYVRCQGALQSPAEYFGFEAEKET
jgi:hypothetical protein